MAVPKSLIRIKSKEDEQTLAELSSAHRHSQAKCQLVQTSHIKQIILFLFPPYHKHLESTKLSRSTWENLDLGHVYTPHCIQSVLTTLVKILRYRPPARLIRPKQYTAPLLHIYIIIISINVYHVHVIFFLDL